jgi:hypothetical protein
MSFSNDDFTNDEINAKLSVIVMTMIGKPPMTNFHKMLDKDKRKFNGTLNEYIKKLPKEEWKDILTSQYNHICSDEIFNEQFNPKKYEPMDINTEIQLLES